MVDVLEVMAGRGQYYKSWADKIKNFDSSKRKSTKDLQEVFLLRNKVMSYHGTKLSDSTANTWCGNCYKTFTETNNLHRHRKNANCKGRTFETAGAFGQS